MKQNRGCPYYLAVPQRSQLVLVTLGLLLAAPARAEPPPHPVLAVALSQNQRLAAAAIGDRPNDTSSVKVWDATSGKELFTKKSGDGRTVSDLEFSPDGKLLAVAVYRDPLVLLDSTTGKVVATLDHGERGSPPLYLSLAFRRDGAQLAAGAEDGVYLFAVPSGKEVSPGPVTGRAYGVAYSPDGSRLVIGGGGSLEVWDPATKFPKKYDASSLSPTFSKDGSMLAVRTDDSIELLDGKKFSRIAATDPNGDGLLRGANDVAFAPDGKWLAVATLDGLAWYQLPKLERKYVWNGPLFETTAVTYASDGKLALTGQRDGVARLVDVTGNKPKIVRELGTPSGPPSTDPRATQNLAQAGDAGAPKGRGGYAGTPPPAGSAKLLAAVVDAAASARHPPGLGTDPTPYGKACLDAVAKARAANIPETAEVRIGSLDDLPGSRPDPESESFRYMPLSAVRSAICMPAFAKGYLSTLAQTSARSCAWLAKVKAGPNGAYANDLKNPNFLALGVEEGKACLAAVAAARNAGVTNDTSIEVSCEDAGLAETLTLAEVEQQVCKATLGSMGDLKQADDAKTAALYAPYLKVLTGDRAKIFAAEKMLGSVYYYGPGKKRLSTPADFKNARTWYWYSYDHASIPPTWNVSGYKFSGDKKIGTYSKAGRGQDAPASAFP